jgi:hypothetical protein
LLNTITCAPKIMAEVYQGCEDDARGSRTTNLFGSAI